MNLLTLTTRCLLGIAVILVYINIFPHHFEHLSETFWIYQEPYRLLLWLSAVVCVAAGLILLRPSPFTRAALIASIPAAAVLAVMCYLLSDHGELRFLTALLAAFAAVTAALAVATLLTNKANDPLGIADELRRNRKNS